MVVCNLKKGKKNRGAEGGVVLGDEELQMHVTISASERYIFLPQIDQTKKAMLSSYRRSRNHKTS
jgi:hypothetical protein